MEEYTALIKKRLSKNRYEHSLGVAQTARNLALSYEVDPEQAYLAGILHDYAKELSNQELLELGKMYDLILDDAEIREPALLHGPVGAVLLQKELGINNSEILAAIRYHTTGCGNMNKLTQIIYISDYIEPNRSFPGVEILREITYNNLSQGVLRGLNQTIKYIVDNNQLLHFLSVEARNWLIMSERVSECASGRENYL
ncbi:MAG: hypothetical protein JM58_13335 [Peptococcaceae bacterium BICA1-8]|nr:MAG: hypothetical protein JM58_13335 [Peptococcaceae bacterium BICA1-8]